MHSDDGTPQILELHAPHPHLPDGEHKSHESLQSHELTPQLTPKLSSEPAQLDQGLLDSIQAVKDKLRARVPVQISIIKVEVDNLPKVHRFVRNRPWLKAQYGSTFSWSAEYVESEIGDCALWNDLGWSFTVERNERDRQDLIFAICSKDMIIGRYILNRDEITELAESAIANYLEKTDVEGDGSEFISIEGEIINAIGPAGLVHILLCRKVLGASAEGNPNDLEMAIMPTPQDATPKVSRPPSPSESLMPLFSYTEVTVRLLSIAVMDLHAVHFLQANSPTVCVDVGNYVNLTEAAASAGMAAKWGDLFWRFTVHRDHGMVITVLSNSVLIGKCVFATEELISMAPTPEGVVSLVKLLSNGRELTGKIKLNMIINHPEDVFAPAASLTNDMRESAYPTDRNMPVMQVEDEGVSEGKGGDPHVSADNSMHDWTLAHPSSSSVLESLPAQMRIKAVPFTIVVQEITVLDVKLPALLAWMPGRGVKLRLHIGCGSNAHATSDLKTNGRFAHWLDMVWKIPVFAANATLRVTLWSKSTGLGEASLSVADLLGMPTTRTGRTEIFTKIMNEAGDITGKVRLSCHYERGVPAVGAIEASPVKSKGKEKKDFSPTKSVDLSALGPMPSVAGSVATKYDEPVIVSFPLAGTVKTISLVDVIALQTSLLFKPSVAVQMICDRKAAVTADATPTAGAAKFIVDWNMYIRKDSLLTLSVLTKKGVVGKAEIPTEKLVDHPLSNGQVTVSVILKKDGMTSGKAIVTFALKNSDVLDLDDRSTVSPAPFSPEQAAAAGTIYITDPMERTVQLLQSSEALPRMPWTGGGMGGYNGSVMDRTLGTHNASHAEASTVFDPRMLSSPLKPNENFDFAIIIDEVDVWDLIAAHAVGKNSPFVSIACGKWATSTTVQELAGNTCYWTGLNWTCHLLDNKTKLRLTVHSRQRIMGTCFFDLDQLVHAGTDNMGYRRLQGNVQDPKKNLVGKIKISYKLDVHKKAPVAPNIVMSPQFRGYPDTASRADQQSYIMSAGASLEDSLMDHSLDLDDQSAAQHLNFPCTFVLNEMVTMELFPVHAVGKNIPSIKVQCGNFYQVTERNVDGLELSSFKNLEWAFPVDLTAYVKFTVVSKDVFEVGTAELDVAKFADIPPGVKGLRETMLLIKRKGLSAGKLVIRARLTALEETYHDVHHPSPGGMVAGSGRSQMLPPIGPQGQAPVSQVLFNNSTANTMQASIASQGGSIYAKYKSKKMPGHTQSLRNMGESTYSQQPQQQPHRAATSYDMRRPSADQQRRPSAQSFQQSYNNNSFVNQRNNSSSYYAGQTSSQQWQGGPDSQDRNDYDDGFVYEDDGLDHYVGAENLVEGSDDMSYLGNMSVHSRQQADPYNMSNVNMAPMANTNSMASIPAHMGGSMAAGSARNSRSPSPGGMPLTNTPSMLNTSFTPSSRNRTTSGDYANQISPGQGQSSALSVGQSQYSLFVPDTTERGLTVQVFGVFAVELRSVHNFSSNCPTCAIACGKFTFTTPEVKNAGATAAWENLTVAFSFEKKSNLRILLVSKDITIGYCTFNREKLINGKPGQSGSMVVFGELKDPANKISGKVKIVYTIEQP